MLIEAQQTTNTIIVTPVVHRSITEHGSGLSGVSAGPKTERRESKIWLQSGERVWQKTMKRESGTRSGRSQRGERSAEPEITEIGLSAERLFLWLTLGSHALAVVKVQN